MTPVRTPEEARIQMRVHFQPPDSHHPPARFPLLLRQQIVEVAVGPGEIVRVGHPGFVVILESRRPFRVPFGAGHQDLPGEFPVFLAPAQQPGEGQGRRAVQRGNGILPVRPPDGPPLLAQPHRAFGVERRLLGGRRIREQLLRGGHEFLIFVRQIRTGTPPQFRYLFRPYEQPRMSRRNARQQVLARRKRERVCVRCNRKRPPPAPVRHRARRIVRAESPEPAARGQCLWRTVDVERHAARFVRHVSEAAVPRALNVVAGGILLRPP